MAGCTGDIGGLGGSTPTDGPPTVPEVLPGESAKGEGGMSYMRLTGAQWEAGAKLVARPLKPPAVSLPPSEPARFQFDSDQELLGVREGAVTKIREAAEAYADAAVSDADWLGRLLPTGAPASGDARIDAFLNSMLLRAFRRPPMTDELTAWRARMAAATGANDAEKFKNGVRGSLSAVLQMPLFVYRSAVGAPSKIDATPVGGRIPLAPSELATRLSLALFDAPPDDAMLASVAKGDWDSPEKYLTVLDAALADPRGKIGLSKFHEQLYFADQYPQITKDAARFPMFQAGVGVHLREDLLRSVDAVVAAGGGVRELLTTRIAFVNAQTAPLYNLNAVDYTQDYKRVELGPERAGVLTRAGWVAWGAGSSDRRQVVRGLAMLHNVLCESYPTGEPQTFPATYPENLKTSRKRLESVVGGGACKGCHSEILNPKGYAFEHFDAAGMYEALDNGEAVDSTGSVKVDGVAVPFKDHTELLPKLAESKQAQSCYARRMSHYFLGYEHSTMESLLVANVEKLTAERRLSSKDVARIVLSSPAFTTRKITE